MCVPAQESASIIAVTQSPIEGVLRIMDAILKGLINRGHKVSVEPEGKHTAYAVVDGERLTFGITEKVKRREGADFGRAAGAGKKSQPLLRD
jgi:hypothetical protein